MQYQSQSSKVEKAPLLSRQENYNSSNWSGRPKIVQVGIGSILVKKQNPLDRVTTKRLKEEGATNSIAAKGVKVSDDLMGET